MMLIQLSRLKLRLVERTHGLSSPTAAVSVTVADSQPQLVITPLDEPEQGQYYKLALSATYAPNTPASEMIDHWIIDFGDGSGPHTDATDGNTLGQLVASAYYPDTLATATVSITAVEADSAEIIAPTESLILAPPAPVNATFRKSADGTYMTIFWQSFSACDFVVQRQDPGSTDWNTIATIPSSEQSAQSYYFYTDSDISPVTGTGIGYLYRVASESPEALGAIPGTPGVSPPAVATELPTETNSSLGPAGPDGSIFDQGGGSAGVFYQGVTGGWSPTVVDDQGVETEFASGESTTLTLSDLPPNMSVSIIIYPFATGRQTAGDQFILTGPGGVQQVETTDSYVFDMGALTHGQSTATFTLEGIVPDDGTGVTRSWGVISTQAFYDTGHINVGQVNLDAGGTVAVPVSMTSSGIPCAGDILSVNSDDSAVIQPLTNSVTLDASGDGEFIVRGIGGIETSDFVVRDVAGDEGSTTLTPAIETVTSTGTVTQGATYNASNMPGFTFSAPYPSLSDISLYYTTLGSTLPANLMGELTGGPVTLPGSDPTVFIPFTPPDDGKIAPDRYVAVTLSANQYDYLKLPHTYMRVINTDLPTITVNGEQDGADVTVDPQGDPSLLATAAFSTPHDGSLDSETLSWNPQQDIIWLSDSMGTVGKDDLASQPGVYGDPYNSVDSYTFTKAMPDKVYLQAIGGSPSVDGTSLFLTADVSKAATEVVGKQVGDPGNTSEDTQSGLTIVVSSAGMIPDSDTSVAGQLLVGSGLTVEAEYLGPYPQGVLALSDINWFIPGAQSDPTSATAIANYNPNAPLPAPGQPSTQVTILTAANLQQQSVHFYFLPDGSVSDIRKIALDATVGDTGYHASTNLRIWTPSSQLNVSALGSVQVVNGALGLFPDANTPPGAGIFYAGSVTLPATTTFSGGVWSFVQTSNGRRSKATLENQYFPLQQERALDNPPGSINIPYGIWHAVDGNFHFFTDEPQAAFDTEVLNPDGTISEVMMDSIAMDDKYTVYIAFQPGSPDSIPVYLRMADWGFDGYALATLDMPLDGSAFANASQTAVGELTWQYRAWPKNFVFRKA